VCRRDWWLCCWDRRWFSGWCAGCVGESAPTLEDAAADRPVSWVVQAVVAWDEESAEHCVVVSELPPRALFDIIDSMVLLMLADAEPLRGGLWPSCAAVAPFRASE
jgi:hypothetical protein